MKRENLPRSVTGARWNGLLLTADRPALPALRVEVAAGRRLLLRQGENVTLLGVQREDYRGVHYARTALYTSPLRHLRADLAREFRDSSEDDDAWFAKWAHHMTAELESTATGPVHEGEWLLFRDMPSWGVDAHWARLPEHDPDRGHITWFGYGDPEEDARDILPLHALCAPDSDRVKSYRKQYLDGTLPPVLLWWVSGLNSLVVLDGHDRIAAAVAEGGRPPVLVLTRSEDARWQAAASRHHLREYEERIRCFEKDQADGDGLASTRIGVAGRRLDEELRSVITTQGRTRAWPLRGGRAAWERLAEELAPGWRPE